MWRWQRALLLALACPPPSLPPSLTPPHTPTRFVTIISWIPGHGASYLGSSSPIPGGEARLSVFKEVVAAPSLDATGLAWDWSAFNTGELWVALFTFL